MTGLEARLADEDALLLQVLRPAGTPLSFEQARLRRQVLKQAEAHPGSLWMGDWETTDECGTTRCVAGWAQFFARGEVVSDSRRPRREHAEYDAVALLGLTEDEYFGPCHSAGLFYADANTAVLALRRLAEVEPG